MITACAQKPLLWVVEELIDLPFVGGLTGPQCKAERFLCLIFRMAQIQPSPSLVLAMLRQDVHKYLRVGALVYIRMFGSSSMLHEARKIGLDDYRKIRVYGFADNLSGVSVESQGFSLLSTAAAQLHHQQEILFGRKKRRRSDDGLSFFPLPREVEDTKSSTSSDERGENHEQTVEEGLPHSPQYFLSHVDEITAFLYGSDPDGENGHEAKKGKRHSTSARGSSRFCGASTRFLGFSLPSIDYME